MYKIKWRTSTRASLRNLPKYLTKKSPVMKATRPLDYSIIDSQDNAISATTTLNDPYGSKVFVEDLGFFLNKEMDGFQRKGRQNPTCTL